jgi:AcrR family transcriptional regulator
MTRKYTQKKRAERQQETRHRIAAAALELHKTLGPAKTPLSLIAEKAGVQRHTLYAHFPDERSLFMACSGLHQELDPPPEAEPWLAIPERAERVRTALGQIYAWYKRNAALLAGVLRDSEQNETLREVSQERFGPFLVSWQAALIWNGDPAQTNALLQLALSFHTWRTPSDAGMTAENAAETLANMLVESSRWNKADQSKTLASRALEVSPDLRLQVQTNISAKA